MAELINGKLTRRGLLKAGTAMTALPFLGIAAPSVLAQGVSKSPTKVLDFMTNADVAKAEQEGQLVFYCHENEAGTAGIMEGFNKDFPKIKTSYVRAQTGALYNKILSERSAGRFDVDVIQLSDLAPAVDFQKKGGYEHYVSPESSGLQGGPSERAGRLISSGPASIPPASPTTSTKVAAADAPKGWKDILNPRWKGKISCKISASGLQFVQWYTLRKLYGDGFWKEFAKLHPHAFDSPRAVVRPPRQGRRHDHRDRRISRLHPVQEQGRQGRIRRAARRAGGDAACRRRGQQGAASGSGQAVRRLGDVEARPGLVSDQPESLLRFGAHRRAADADRREARRSQAALSCRLG